jgi:hypothetical protein
MITFYSKVVILSRDFFRISNISPRDYVGVFLEFFNVGIGESVENGITHLS